MRSQTYGELGQRRLAELCRALERDDLASTASRTFAWLSRSFEAWPLARGPLWASDITDNHTPFEYSVAFEGATPVVRLLVEAQRARGSLQTQWREGLQLQADLLAHEHLDAERFQRVADLYAPSSVSEARFALWHAAVIRGADAVEYKIYLNPHIDGGDPWSRVSATFERLGLQQTWAKTQARIAGGLFALDPVYVSIDLNTGSDARLKLYLAHPHASVRDWSEFLARFPGHAHQEALRLVGPDLDATQRLSLRPPITCLSFRVHALEPQLTLHYPIRCYVSSDGDALGRCCALLSPAHAHALTRACSSLAGGELGMCSGLITYISTTHQADATRLTVYLAPQAHVSTDRQGVAQADIELIEHGAIVGSDFIRPDAQTLRQLARDTSA